MPTASVPLAGRAAVRPTKGRGERCRMEPLPNALGQLLSAAGLIYLAVPVSLALVVLRRRR
jgi:hypothetical protein